MELFIKDRIYIPQLLPAQNSFMEYNLKKSIIKKVEFSQEERKKYSFKEEGENKLTWDGKLDVANPLKVKFTKEELEFLKSSCEKLAESPQPDEVWAVVNKIYNAAIA